MPILVILVDWGIRALMILILAASLISWFQPDPRNPAIRFLRAIVDPLLHPIRAILPSMEGVDFSPAVAILILYGLQSLIHNSVLH